MINVIHGDNIVLSRKKLDEFNKGQWVIRIDASRDDLVKISNAFEFQELFAAKKTIIIENLFSQKAKQKDKIIELIEKPMERSLKLSFGKQKS